TPPDNIKPLTGCAPSLFVPVTTSAVVKLYSVAKPVPSVLSWNTVPLPPLPPFLVVPYKAPFDKINSASGLAPSLLGPTAPDVMLNVCRTVKPEPSVLILNIVPLPALPPSDAVPYSVLPDSNKLPCGNAPSLLLKSRPEMDGKLKRFVNPVPLVLTEKM